MERICKPDGWVRPLGSAHNNIEPNILVVVAVCTTILAGRKSRGIRQKGSSRQARIAGDIAFTLFESRILVKPLNVVVIAEVPRCISRQINDSRQNDKVALHAIFCIVRGF